MTAPTPAQRAALREAAEKATPGPWHPSVGHNRIYGVEWADGACAPMIAIVNSTPPGTDDNGEYPGCGGDPIANAHFIALANPQMILALLDEIDAKERGEKK